MISPIIREGMEIALDLAVKTPATAQLCCRLSRIQVVPFFVDDWEEELAAWNELIHLCGESLRNKERPTDDKSTER